MDPHTAFLLTRGIKTLPLRMRQHNSNALALARALESSPFVHWVSYPGLESHPMHHKAGKWFSGGYGGMLAFEVRGGSEGALAVLRALRLALVAPSLGALETLVTRPVDTSHAAMPAEEREALGITQGTIRVSVGLEDERDIVADFLQALEAAAATH